MSTYWFQFPADAVTDHVLHPSAVRLLLALCLHTNPTQQTANDENVAWLYEMTGLTTPAFNAALESLKKCGYITVVKGSDEQDACFAFPPRKDWVSLHRSGAGWLLAGSPSSLTLSLFLLLSIRFQKKQAEYSVLELASELASELSAVIESLEVLERDGYIHIEQPTSSKGIVLRYRYSVLL